MELVAASKLRRAQQRVLSARPYAESMRVLVGELAGQGSQAGIPLHPLLAERPIRNVGIVVLTPDRGLAGPLIGNILRRTMELVAEEERAGHGLHFVTVGRRGQDFLLRRGRTLEGTFLGVVDRPSYDSIVPIARLVMDAYQEGRIDRAYLVLPRFVSTLVQRPEVVQLLPVTSIPKPNHDEAVEAAEYIFEPDPLAILNALLPRYVEVQVYQAVLETSASEQSAKMVAMRNATDNGKELVRQYSLTYNKVRQAGITREVTEIASAAEAMAASSAR